MATYVLNGAGVAKARALIDARQYRIRSLWADVRPRAAELDAFVKARSWEEYGAWHLALAVGEAERTRARYALVFGDFRRLHRTGLIACRHQAARWGHEEIEHAAHDLIQHLDRARS